MVAVQQQRETEADDHLAGDGQDHVFRGDREIGPDVIVVEQVAIVLQADELGGRTAGGAEICRTNSRASRSAGRC